MSEKIESSNCSVIDGESNIAVSSKKRKRKVSKFADPRLYAIVAGNYYHFVYEPSMDGQMERKLKLYPRAMVNADFRGCSVDVTDKIPRYVAFCNIPSHTAYRQIVTFQGVPGCYYNLYKDVQIYPMNGQFPITETFLRHLFRERYELFLDYFRVLYEWPIYPLPVLLLISDQRSTGKSTFLNWLKCIFKGNVALINSVQFRSKFNSMWASKLIVGVDEATLRTREDSEKIKFISTAKRVPLEKKGVDSVEIESFIKIVLTANDGISPVKIDDEENRFWVERVLPFENDEDPFILEKMKTEIPFFVHFVLSRQMIYPSPITRMWFPYKSYSTVALRSIVSVSNNTYHRIALAESLLEVMDNCGIDAVSCTLGELKLFSKRHSLQIPDVVIHEILRHNWKESIYYAVDNLTYMGYFSSDGEILLSPEKRTGRFYTITKDFLETVV